MLAKRVLAPLSIFALLRTISEIIGKPPPNATIVLPVPTAKRSRSWFVLRLYGSIWSTALALSNDSKVPMSANKMMYCTPVAVAIPEKSGNVTASNMLLGTLTKCVSPSPKYIPKGTVTKSATKGAGTARSLSSGKPNMITKLTRPIKPACGSMSRMNSGIRASRPSGEPSAWRPIITGNCLEMMITPMEASNPCTGAVGKNSPKAPSLKRPNRIWMAPATTATPRARW